MEETITFWLDNKISSGFKVAEIGSQALVSYRDKFFIVEGGAAKMKGVRPLYYSKSSMPLVWKKAMKGILPPLEAPVVHSQDECLPVTASTNKERTKMQKQVISALDRSETCPQMEKPQQTPARQLAHSKTSIDTKPMKTSQLVVIANCPYCNQKHDLPIEKGKNGKPFFVACAKCNAEFAVRFVPVTMYQAQVAAFR